MRGVAVNPNTLLGTRCLLPPRCGAIITPGGCMKNVSVVLAVVFVVVVSVTMFHAVRFGFTPTSLLVIIGGVAGSLSCSAIYATYCTDR